MQKWVIFFLQFLVKIGYPFNFCFLLKQNREMYGKSERLDYGHKRLERKRKILSFQSG